MSLNNKKKTQGVGLSLRLENIDEVLDKKHKIPFLEVIVDNWLSDGPHHKKLEKIRQDYELSFHCVGMNLCGEDKLDLGYLKKIKELKQRFEPIHVSDHLCVTAHKNSQHHDLLPFPFNEKYLSNSIERVSYIQNFFKEQILVENLSYYIEFNSSAMSEIDFLNELNQQSDCLNLLDLNNIWVNEKNLNIKTGDYLEKVQWSRVKEIHVAGPEKINGIYIDTHGTDIYPELFKIIKKHRNQIVNIPVLYERDNHQNGLTPLLEQKKMIEKALYG